MPPISRQSRRFVISALLLFGLGLSNGTACPGAEPKSTSANFQRNQLVAWCIVPFDARKRGPAERAQMVADLGLKRVAYDWRAEHIPQFEREIQEYHKRDIEFFAFWSWHDSLAPLIEKYDVHPQIWLTNPSPSAESQAEKIKLAATHFLPLVQKTRQLGCKLGLYNHGGWGGEPENLVAVCKYLREHHNADHVGIVYNFHHGHEHISDFPASFRAMQPYLLCLNLNGMDYPQATPFRKILPLGEGTNEASMIQTVLDNGYQGPVGILDHRNELDAQESLSLNLKGLQAIFSQLEK